MRYPLRGFVERERSETHAGRAAATHPTGGATPRLQSIDLLRGVVIVLMVLDHVRAYFSDVRFDPLDPAHTNAALYVTRWITHFCAPIFVLLAGTGAYLYGRRHTRAELSRFLATRGIWLIALELTVVGFGWFFNLRFEMGFLLQVIWAIGVSMLVLACLVRLHTGLIAALGLAIVCGHNLLDGVSLESAGAFAPLWSLLHVRAQWPYAFVLYPVLPWIGLMALGYALGRLYQLPAEVRRRRLTVLGCAAIAAFLLLRLTGVYGDPQPWQVASSLRDSLMSFFDVEKYPPSLAYVLVTIGPALLALAYLEQARGALAAALTTFGRVPMLVYVAHIYLVHLAAGLLALALGFGTVVLTNVFIGLPEGWGFGLPVVYLVWGLVFAALYPLARWFAAIKARRNDWWLSYL